MCDISDPRILNTYISIVDDESTDWLILGYNGTRDTISLYAYGNQGLSEFRNNLTNEILFGFVRIEGKFAFITYIPERISGVTRARALVHSRYITSNLIEIPHIDILAARLNDFDDLNICCKLKLKNGVKQPSSRQQQPQSQQSSKRRYSKRSSSAAFLISQQQQPQQQLFDRRQKSDVHANLPFTPFPTEDALSETNLNMHLLQHNSNQAQKRDIHYNKQQDDVDEIQQIIMTPSLSTPTSITSDSTIITGAMQCTSSNLLNNTATNDIHQKAAIVEGQQEQHHPTTVRLQSSLAAFSEEPVHLLNQKNSNKGSATLQYTEEYTISESKPGQTAEHSVDKERRTPSSAAENFNGKNTSNKLQITTTKNTYSLSPKIHMSGYISVVKNGSPFRKRRLFIMKDDCLSLFQDSLCKEALDLIHYQDLIQPIKPLNEDEDEDIYVPHSYFIRTKRQQDSFQFIADDKQFGKQFYTVFTNLQQQRMKQP
ncbi:hypothetical protein BDF20DRAFT_45009 [Mycotypha africana]|uniref:uncharacterized protein n=1 Tax=Mycotypha africana TaxID=64632 RepID=UPI002300E5E3|nr:uncharacterized protein BDF20DRAFT_45009 [Mycotypha africana]KAI8991467.1 hypothetical protein BDF20DRAFT_45009 [Mycotypha africana]